jgi:hypothetical protein
VVRSRRAFTLGLGAVLVLIGLALQVPVSSVTRAAASVNSTSSVPAFTSTEVVTRDHQNADGSDDITDSRTFSLSVDRDTDLRGYQQLRVSWSGAHPTGGIVGDESSSDAAAFEEYPVVLMECRGIDSTSAPTGEQLSPKTCWTQTVSERYNEDNNSAFPVWRLDRYASANDTADIVGAPNPLNPSCVVDQPEAARWVPFVAADGTEYDPGYFGGPGCNPLAPEAGNVEDTGAPGNTTYAVTDPAGNGNAKFVVWTADQNASLGCSDSVPCALVVIPIMGVSCVSATAVSESADDDAACRSLGLYRPGQLVNPSKSDLTVTGDLWWTASNWRNRITVPLTFAESSSVCSVVSHSTPVLMYGSPPMAEATQQWAPEFCTDPTKFTFRHVQTGEPEAKNLLGLGLDTGSSGADSSSPAASASASAIATPTAASSASTDAPTASNGVEAVLESDAPPDGYSSPTVQAPVALTGFAISYIIDDTSGHEYTNLKLTPRLLAKLLTESYPDISAVYNAYPALAKNPVNITQDPEFVALNPGLPRLFDAQDAAATLYAISSNADTIFALTSYINADPEARAWLDGTPDPWGMVVNPNYRGISLPVESWPLLDSFIASFGHSGANNCIDDAPVPYLPLVASPTSALSSIAQALQYAAPLSQTDCTLGGGSSTLGNKLTTPPRQIPGQRFMIGLTSLADAEYYGLDTAALQTYQVAPDPTAQFTTSTGRLFAAPTDDSLIAAARLASPNETTGTWPIPYAAMRQNPADAAAYPGTMFVYLAVPTAGLPTTDAADFASFIRFAATTGQTPGFGNGQLPPGYAPMTSADGLGDQVAFALRVASVVAGQRGTVPTLLGADEPVVSAPPPVSPGPATTPATTQPAPVAVGPTRAVPGQAIVPPPTIGAAPTQGTTSAVLPVTITSSAPATVSPTALAGTTIAHSSSLAGSVLPSILAIGLGAVFVASGLRWKVRP